jgi:hypothetical protein
VTSERGAWALAALIQGFGGADTIAFAAEFAFWGGAGGLLAGTRLGFRQFRVNQTGLTGLTGFRRAETQSSSSCLGLRFVGPIR